MESKTGFLDDMSEQQAQVLREIRKYVHEELSLTNSARWTDWNMLRFCRASKFDIYKTKGMIDEFLKFADTLKIDRLGELKEGMFGGLRKMTGFGLCNTDQSRRPVIVDLTRLLKAKELLAHYPQEEIILFFVQYMERLVNIVLPECSKAAVRRVEQICVVIDLSETHPMLLFNGKFKELLKRLIEIFQNFYPELLGNMFIVKAGIGFMSVWAILKGWISHDTRNKIKIIPGRGRKVLNEVIGQENLPIALDGKSPNDIRSDEGPWRNALEKATEMGTIFHPFQAIVRQYFFTDEEKISYLNKKLENQKERENEKEKSKSVDKKEQISKK